MIIKMKCNQNLGRFKEGQVVQIQANDKGVPVDKFWRNRLRDAEVDGCCEIVKEDKKVSKKKSEQSE